MTATFQQSFFSSFENANGNSNKRANSSKKALRLFQVDIEFFDNEYESHEIEARDYADAAEQAEARFSNIYNMNIYEIY
jgi:hypothetical protein